MTFFKKLRYRPRREEWPAADLSPIGVDMHSHFIAGIDDGAPTTDDALVLIRALHEMGLRKFITTPHIFLGVHNNSPATILPGLERLRSEVAAAGIPVEIEAAAEYYLDEHFEMLTEKKELLTFGKNHVLFEISFASEPANLARAIFHMHLNQYKPVLAHPERYEFWHRDLSKYEALADKDVALQLNINSLTGHYGPGVKRMSERLIDAGLITLLGSDCHHPGHVELMEAARKTRYVHKLLESGRLKNHTL